MASSESGIDVSYDTVELSMDDFDKLLKEECDIKGFYKIRSRPPMSSSPPASVRSIHTNSRTSFKQQLMRTQQQEEEQRLKQQQQQQLQCRQLNSQQQRSLAKTVGDPVSVPGAVHHVPGDGDAQSSSMQVQSLLENPTLYHVLQTRDRLERHQASSSNSSDAGSPSNTPMGASTQRLGHPQVTVVSRSAVEISRASGSLCASADGKSKGYSMVWPRSDPGSIAKVQHTDRRAVETSASKQTTVCVAGSSNAGSFRIPSVMPASGDNSQYFGTPKSVEMTDAIPSSFKERQESDVTMQCVDNQNSLKRSMEDTSIQQRPNRSDKPPSLGAPRMLSSGQTRANMEQVGNPSQNSYSHQQLTTMSAHQNHSNTSRAVENQQTATAVNNSAGLRHMAQKVSHQFSSSGYSGSLGGVPSPVASASTVASVASSGLSSAPASFTSDVSEVDDVIEEILSLEESQGLRHVDSTYQASSDVLGLGPDSTSGGDLPRVKLEEPQVESEVQMIAIIKDRQKKDNHNMIERRRRFNINDRIKELATLLPKTHEPYFDLVRDLRHNKGEILKASVDYIRRMKADVEASKESEAKRRSLEQQNRQLHLKIQELEARLRQNGIKVEGTSLSPSLIPTLINSESQQPQFEHNLKLENNNSNASRSEGSNCTNVYNVTCSPSTSSTNVNTNDSNINTFNSNFNVNVSHTTNTVQNTNPFNQNTTNINCSTTISNPFSFKAECSAESSTCNSVIASRAGDCNYNEDSDFSTINLDAMENLNTHGISFNTNLEDTINTSICSPRVTSSNLSPGNFLSPDHSSTYSAPPDRNSPETLQLDTPTSTFSTNLHPDHQFSNSNLLMPSSDLLTRTLTSDAITRETLTRDALSSDDLTPEDLTPLFPASDHLLGSEAHGASSKSNFDDHSRNDCSSDSQRNDDRKVRPFHCLSESECHDDMSLINELLQDLNAHPFGLDLMEDDPVSGVYSCDPMFSSPQVPSTPYDSPSSLHDSLSPDSMDIVS